MGTHPPPVEPEQPTADNELAITGLQSDPDLIGRVHGNRPRIDPPVDLSGKGYTSGQPIAELSARPSSPSAIRRSRRWADSGQNTLAQHVSDYLDHDVRILDPGEWEHGGAMDIFLSRTSMSMRPLVEVLDRENEAGLSTPLMNELADARLDFDVDDREQRAKREVEAEAVAYVLGRYFGLDTANSAFYLAAWEGEDAGTIQDRLDRISQASAEMIETIDGSMNAVPA